MFLQHSEEDGVESKEEGDVVVGALSTRRTATENGGEQLRRSRGDSTQRGSLSERPPSMAESSGDAVEGIQRGGEVGSALGVCHVLNTDGDPLGLARKASNYLASSIQL